MPSGSKKTKEDTWTENELANAIQGDKKEKKHRSRDKEPKDPSKEKEKRSEKHKDDKDGMERKHRKREDKNTREVRSEDKEQRQHKERDKENGERKHRNKDKHDEDRKERKQRDHNSKEDEESEREREKRHRDKERDRRDRKDNGEEKKEHRKDKEKEKEKTREDRDKDRDREPKEHRVKETEEPKDKDKDKKRRKHRDESTKDRSDSGKDRHKSKESRSRDTSGKERKHRESSGKSKDYKNKAKDIEKQKAKEIERELELKRLAEEEEEKKRKEEEEANAAYGYDDDFDDYEDDDFEDEDGGYSEEEKKSQDVKNAVDDSSALDKQKKDTTGGGSRDDVSETEGMAPQQSFLKMSKSEEEGLNEVMKAISAENEKASNMTRVPKDEAKKLKKEEKLDAESDESPPKKVYGKINFVAANKKQINDKVAKRTKKRGEELLKLVQLDVRSIELFDMPPMTEYELYMKRFGSSDSKQMFTQTNDECYEKEVQTDEIETETRWCQHASDIRSAGSEKLTSTDTKNSLDSILNADSARLNKFLMRASKVCLSLLEEIEAGIEQPKKQYVETRTSFSDGYVSLGSSEFLVLGRDVCDMSFSPAQTNMLLTAHGTSNVVMKDLKSSKGLLCVWNTNEPTKPTKLLICESVPKSCCFGSGPASFAFAGMEDGVVAVWDLNEPSYHHETCQIGSQLLIFQTVTFTTAALPDKHSFPVVAITPLTSSTGSGNNDSMDLSFQLATMDQSASVHIWILVRTQGIQSYDLTSVNEDLGLSPNGRVKLVQSAVINPPGASVSSFTHLFTMTCLNVEQGDSNHMYAGTQQGDILHLTRFGNRPTPKVYRSGGGSYKVNANDVCPWKMPYMLACYDDGCVRLFHLKTEDALMTWPNTKNGVALIDVKWSQSKPSVFYTIDSESVLYAWNLLESDIAPVFQLKIQRKDKRAVGFALANDYSASGRGSPGRVAELALIFGDGSVEIHRLNKALSTLSASEFDEMELFLSEVT